MASLKLLAEGNTNYGENLVIWDQILGTYYNPPRPSSTDIGITGKVADSFLAQLAQPFSKKGAKQIIGKKPKELRDKEELAAKAAAAREQANEPIRKSS